MSSIEGLTVILFTLMVEYNSLNKKEQPVFSETAKALNKKFSAGERIWNEGTLYQIRSLPKPIVVDFNGVLVNQHRPWIPNPQAKAFLENLKELGTIVVITYAFRDWDLRRQALQKFGLWHEGMIMITADNWNMDFSTTERDKQQHKQEVEKFTKFKNLKSNEWALVEGKRIGHIFMKEFDIPLIDDIDVNTSNNPGIFGIKVKGFDNILPDEKGYELKGVSRLVEKHYSNFSLSK